MNPEITAKCMSCGKKWVMTLEQQREAATVGVPFSPCCQSVAVVESVKARIGVSGKRP